MQQRNKGECTLGFLNRNYANPGPGVEKDEPRKKGVARFLEIAFRDGWPMLGANAILCLAALPGCLGVSLAMTAGGPIVAILVGALGGMLAAPCLCGLCDLILRALRDEPGYWWHTYRKHFAENAKVSLLPGAVFGAITTAQIISILQLLQTGGDTALLLGVAISAVFTTLIQVYFWPQLVLMELPLPAMVKNSVLLAFTSPARSLPAAIGTVAYWAVMLLWFPLTAIWLLVAGFSFINLFSLLMIYRPFNETFQIEEKVRAKHEQTQAE